MIEDFDIVAYFEDRGIEYHLPGEKNVSRGWININCPFCADPSWHCGINLESLRFHCWICGERGSVVKLVKELEGCGWTRAEMIVGDPQFKITSEHPLICSKSPHNRYRYEIKNKGFYIGLGGKIKSRGDFARILPPTVPLTPAHKHYLKGRGFDPDYLERTYRLRSTLGAGAWKMRIVIPVHLNGQIVNWIARAVKPKQKPTYLSCPNDRAIYPLRQLLYNIDSISRSRIVIVEGVFDVWRVGEGAVATFGTEVTDEQIDLLLQTEVRDTLILFDADAIDKAHKLASRLSTLGLGVEVGELNRGDPAEMPWQLVEEVKEWLKG